MPENIQELKVTMNCCEVVNETKEQLFYIFITVQLLLENYIGHDIIYRYSLLRINWKDTHYVDTISVFIYKSLYT